MGASGWEYIEPFDTDLATTLANLRQRVFEEDDYFWHDSLPKPATLAELDTMDMFEGEPDFDDPEFQILIEMRFAGTHSVLDALSVGSGGDISIMTPARVAALVGSPQPSRAEFDRVPEARKVEALRGGLGACVPLHDESGAMTEVAFWGISGD